MSSLHNRRWSNYHPPVVCEGDSHLINNSFVSTLPPNDSPSSPHNQAILPHTLTRGLYVGHCLHNLFSLPAPTPTTSTQGTQAIFWAKPFHVLYPTLSTAVTLHTHLPMKMEQTQCSEMLAFKLQMLGNNPEERIGYTKVIWWVIGTKKVEIWKPHFIISFAIMAKLFLEF
jgi:hypothetical protein